MMGTLVLERVLNKKHTHNKEAPSRRNFKRMLRIQLLD